MAKNIHDFLSRCGIGNKSHRDEEYKRLSWDEYFMSLSHMVARRSHDSQTQHGCVIVDENNRIVSTGCNGFPSNGPDKDMPNTRPLKYPFMVHAELNAILSSKQDLSGCRMYITGDPCNPCFLHLITAGIRDVIVGRLGHVKSEDWESVHETLKHLYKVNVRKFKGCILLAEIEYD